MSKLYFRHISIFKHLCFAPNNNKSSSWNDFISVQFCEINNTASWFMSKFSLSWLQDDQNLLFVYAEGFKSPLFGFVTLLKKIYKIPNITMTDKMHLSIYQWRCYCIDYLAKAGTCVRDRCALQQLALNVHVKHSDLTWLFSKDHGLFPNQILPISCLNRPSAHCSRRLMILTFKTGRPFDLVIEPRDMRLSLRLRQISSSIPSTLR